MRTDWTKLDPSRKSSGPYASKSGDRFGAFFFPGPRANFVAIASEGSDEIPWEHVSVRAIQKNGTERCPTWEEMCVIKAMFWDDEECVIEYHPARAEYVNNHHAVLHLWKPVGITFPVPPSIAVGIKGLKLIAK